MSDPGRRAVRRKRPRTASATRLSKPAAGFRSDGDSSGDEVRPQKRPAAAPPSPPPTTTASAVVESAAAAGPTLRELHAVFRHHPDLEDKYLRLMRLPITGKDSLSLPFDLRAHRQHTCVDLSPYSNDQISRSACTVCARGDLPPPPTASDSMVAFIQQPANVMRHRRYYYGFRKDAELLAMSAVQPEIFQIYYILQACVPDVFPIMYATNSRTLNMRIYFERPNVHIPAACLQQLMAVADDAFRLTLDITLRQHLTLSATCVCARPHQVRIDPVVLQSKVEELDIPNDVAEKFERFDPSLAPPTGPAASAEACSTSRRHRPPSPAPSRFDDEDNRRGLRLGMV